jgi:hypothetical protein
MQAAEQRHDVGEVDDDDDDDGEGEGDIVVVVVVVGVGCSVVVVAVAAAADDVTGGMLADDELLIFILVLVAVVNGVCSLVLLFYLFYL